MRNPRLKLWIEAALIAALYTALSFINIPVSFFQLRPAEALTILPLFTAAAIPGLSVGCLLANYLTGCLPPDLVFGTLATLLGALGTYFLRKKPFFAPLPPILSNTLILPPVILWAYGAEGNLPLPLLALSVFLGELLSAGLLGLFLYRSIRPLSEKHKFF